MFVHVKHAQKHHTTQTHKLQRATNNLHNKQTLSSDPLKLCFRDSSDEEPLSLNATLSTDTRRRKISMATRGPTPGGGEEDESERRDSSVHILVGSELR